MIGIMNGMVMQRNSKDVSEIYVYNQKQINNAAYSGEHSGKISIVKIGDEEYCLSGIPVGGPYSLDIDGELFRDIYVGDVWILGGQSNMQGVGWLSFGDKTPKDDSVRALYMQDCWDAAKEPLHEMWKAKDLVHTKHLNAMPPEKELYQGVGPGISFACEMKRLTGVPQGLLCCAHGGASLDQWSEKLKDNGPDASLYSAMLRRYKANGSNVRGMFWFQGCADAFECTGDTFLERMISFMKEFNNDFGDIPTVQVQIARVVHPLLNGLRENWMKIREAQRIMPQRIKNLYTISAISMSTDDLIHLARASQHELGLQGAHTMYQAIYGTNENGFLPPIEIGEISYKVNKLSNKVDIMVNIKNVVGQLQCDGRPSGFYLTRNKYEPDEDFVFDIRLEGNSIRVRAWLEENDIENMYIYYGYGLNPYCNIKDSQGRELPCFGPIKLSK